MKSARRSKTVNMRVNFFAPCSRRPQHRVSRACGGAHGLLHEQRTVVARRVVRVSVARVVARVLPNRRVTRDAGDGGCEVRKNRGAYLRRDERPTREPDEF